MRDGTMEQHGSVDVDMDVDTPGSKSNKELEEVKDGRAREDGSGAPAAAADDAGSAGEGGVVKEKLDGDDSEPPRLAVVTACEDGAVKVSIEVMSKSVDKDGPGQSEAADLPAVLLPVCESTDRSREQVYGSDGKVGADERPVLASGDGEGGEGGGGGEECSADLLEPVTLGDVVADPSPAKAGISGEEELRAGHIARCDELQGLKDELQRANIFSVEAEVDLSNPVIDGKEKECEGGEAKVEECKGGEVAPSVLLKPEVAAVSDPPPVLLKAEVSALSDHPPVLSKPEACAMSDPLPVSLKPEVVARNDSDSDHAPIILRRTLKRTANRAVLVLQSDDEEKTSADQDGSEHSSETVRCSEHEAEELTGDSGSEAEELTGDSCSEAEKLTRFIDSEAEESDPHFGDDDEFSSDCDKPRDTDSEDEGVDLMEDFIDDEAEESFGDSDSNEEEPTEDFNRETDRSSQDEEDVGDTDAMHEDSAEVQTSREMEDDDQRDVEAPVESPLQQVEAATARVDRLDDRKAQEQTALTQAPLEDAFAMEQDVQAIFDHERRLHSLISRLLSSEAITADDADLLRNNCRSTMVDASVQTDFPQIRPDSTDGTTVPNEAGVEEEDSTDGTTVPNEAGVEEEDDQKGPGVNSEDVTVQSVQPESEQDVVDFAQKQSEIGGTVNKKRRAKVKDKQDSMLPPPVPVEEILEPKDLAEFFKRKKRIRRVQIVESESDDNEISRGAGECDITLPAEGKGLAMDRLTKWKKGKRTQAQSKPLEPRMCCDLTSDDEAELAGGRQNEMDPELAVTEGEVQAKRDDRDGESDGKNDERVGEGDERAVEKDEIRGPERKKKRKTNAKQYDGTVPSDGERLVSERVTKIQCDFRSKVRRSRELGQEGQPSEVEIDADRDKTSPENHARNGDPAAVGETATGETRTGKLRKTKRKERSDNCDGEGSAVFLHGKPKRKHAKRKKLVREHPGTLATLDVGTEEVHADAVSGFEKEQLPLRAQEFSDDAVRRKKKARPKKPKAIGLYGSAELGIPDDGFLVSGVTTGAENQKNSEHLALLEPSGVDLESELPLEISAKKQQDDDVADHEVGASSFVKKPRGKKVKSRQTKASFSHAASGVASGVAEHTELGGNNPHGPSEPEFATRDNLSGFRKVKKSMDGAHGSARALPDNEKGSEEEEGREEMTLDSIWRSYMSPEWPGPAVPGSRPEKLHRNRRTTLKDTSTEVVEPQRVIIPYSPAKINRREAASKKNLGLIGSIVSDSGVSSRDDMDFGEERLDVGMKKRKNKKSRRT